jgi:acyl-homoserine-lactone acylase
MKRSEYKAFMLILVVVLEACVPPGDTPGHTTIRWDAWGVPHIDAANNEELFYAFGWAQMHMHGALVLRLYGESRGRAAEYWGGDMLPSDSMVHTLDFPDIGARWYAAQRPEFKAWIDAFARGMNDYAHSAGADIDAEYRQVLPVVPQDIFNHFIYVNYRAFLVRDQVGRTQKWLENGSNGYALAPSRTASGNAMLVQNPHLPWSGPYTWMEAGLKAPGVHAYGATLLGLPVLGIAFNEHLGWTHTNNTIDVVDLYALTVADGGYVLDGNTVPFEERTKTLRVRTDGGMKDRTLTIRRTVHGPVIGLKGSRGLAVRLPIYIEDTPFGAEQWWNMATATGMEQFEAALRMHQIPSFNVLYADRQGNIFYLFNGHVPKRIEGDWSFWDGIVPGDQSKLIWNGLLDFDALPFLKNPATGWVQNANDPPWTCTFPMPFERDRYPSYLAPSFMLFRQQRAVKMMLGDSSITFDELVDYKHSTYVEGADRLIDDLRSAVYQYGDAEGKAALAVVESWDRTYEADSRGAVLFAQWMSKFSFYNPATFAKTWDPADPLNTPDGFSDPVRAVRKFEEAIAEVEALYGALDVPWGAVYRLQRGDYDFPANGGPEVHGVFRVTGFEKGDGGIQRAGSGDTYTAVVEFGDRVRARGSLSYGNSSDPDSPHYGDQLELYAGKSLRDILFYDEDLEGHVVREEVLGKHGFTEQ